MHRPTLSRYAAASLLALSSLAANAAAQEVGRGAQPVVARPPALSRMIHPSLVSCSAPPVAAGRQAATQRRRAPVCAPHTADCNGDTADGCETNLDTSTNHCGQCNKACVAGQTCSGGACVGRPCTLLTFYKDADNDGFGVAGSTVSACTRPAGYAATAYDCDDANAAIRPSASEVCGNGKDDNCDARVDENCP